MRTTFLALSFFTLSAFAGNYEYTLKNYPPEAKGCHETAADIGARFQQATGIAPLKSRCLEDTASGYHIAVTYSAQKPLNLVSTSQAWGAISSRGRFSSRENCQAGMDNELKIFVEETGLKVAVNYCGRDGISSEKTAWYPRIDAFGESKRTPQMSSYFYFGVPKGIDGKTLREKIFAGLKARGVRAFAIIFRSQLAYGDATVHYYAESRLKFDMVEATRTDTLEQCLAQMEEVTTAFVGSTNPPLVHYCGTPAIGNQFELSLLFVGTPLEIRDSSESYKTFAECEAARPALIDYYKKTLKLPIRLGLCSQPKLETPRLYRVTLFEDRL